MLTAEHESGPTVQHTLNAREASEVMRISKRTVYSGFAFLVTLAFVLFVFLSLAKAQKSLPDSPKAKITSAEPQTKVPPETGWPRTFTSGPDSFTIYPPQVDKWEKNIVDLYCAVELKSGKETAAKYGVVWFQARTGRPIIRTKFAHPVRVVGSRTQDLTVIRQENSP